MWGLCVFPGIWRTWDCFHHGESGSDTLRLLELVIDRCSSASFAGTLVHEPGLRWKKSDHLETGQVAVTASPSPVCPQRLHLP